MPFFLGIDLKGKDSPCCWKGQSLVVKKMIGKLLGKLGWREEGIKSQSYIAIKQEGSDCAVLSVEEKRSNLVFP